MPLCLPLWPWRKALGRAKSLSVPQLVGVGARRARAALRARVEELQAGRLSLGQGAERLASVVPGATSVADAIARIERSAGALPVSASALPELLRRLDGRFPGFAQGLRSRADRACNGSWDILGYPPAQLGRLPDWQQDFVSGQRWDAAQPSRLQLFVCGGGSDIKIPWEVSRLQHLPAVAHAFHLERDPRYLALICEQLEDWIARNPVGHGVNWKGPMEVALRAVSIVWAWELCRSDDRIPSPLRAKVYWSLFAHGHFLRGHLEDGGSFKGNHYVANLLGLIWIGHLYPALEGASGWRDEGLRRLIRHLPEQIASDGGDREASIAYHRLVAEMIGLAATVTRDPELIDAFARMARFTAGILKPDGTAPQLGDNDGGRAFRLVDRAPLDHRYLPAWGGLLRPPLTQPMDVEAALLTGMLPSSEGVVRPPASVQEFPASQLTVLQEGQFYALLSATPVGQSGAGGHGHNDTLALELFFEGDVIVDPGSFCYTSAPALRNAFRGTAAHATLQVDTREQNPVTEDLFHLPEQARAKIVRSEAQGEEWVWVAEHRGFKPYLHQRTVRLDLAARQLRIRDEVLDLGTKAAEQPAPAIDITSRFPLAPGISARIVDGGFLLSRAGKDILRLLAPEPAQLAIGAGWYSPDYGSRLRCQVLCASLRGKAPLTLELDLVATWPVSQGG